MNEQIENHLKKIYQEENLKEAISLFRELLTQFTKIKGIAKPSSQTAYFITYGDSFYEMGKLPLKTLEEVLEDKLPFISDVHILPMFPYTSDDGFSVVDYLSINPTLGTWENIQSLAQKKRLMFDFVCNHMSKSSEWFQRFLADDSEYRDAFVVFNEKFDTSQVVRPRTSPLFHEYQSKNGRTKRVWTTFSEDQVDTNVKDPKMLARLTGALLEYIRKGASSIRLDAIGFMWKESGTSSMHLQQTHEIIKLWRTIVNLYAPHVQLITETNVPHLENISYFGNKEDEANMVYQFPLPPLVLHTFLSKNATKLTKWAQTIHPVSDTATYFNFLASHDGIGLRPTEGILTDDERDFIIQEVLNKGGLISYKNNPDGSQSVYEMNINYASALGSEKKVLAAHAILFSLLGVPAIYYHSIFGSKNDEVGAKMSGINRRINREKLEKNRLYKELETIPFRQVIYSGLAEMLTVRGKEEAFNPYGDQEVLQLDDRVFSIVRRSAGQKILSLTNVTNQTVKLEISGTDILTNQSFNGQLEPYQYVWVKQ